MTPGHLSQHLGQQGQPLECLLVPCLGHAIGTATVQIGPDIGRQPLAGAGFVIAQAGQPGEAGGGRGIMGWHGMAFRSAPTGG